MIEIRDPIHGFIELTEWEKDIIDSPILQRLRRIRQLVLTDMLYPGGMHTRFEHSLGVMQVATRMFDHLIEHREKKIKEIGFSREDLERDRVLLRLACLLHDIGHPPFSHAGESVMPFRDEVKKANANSRPKHYKHEHYSAAIIQFLMKDLIDNHPANGFGITCDDIAGFLTKNSSTLNKRILWTDLVSGQIDADRADYLLRDSHHLGVAYGHYDLGRLISTLNFTADKVTGSWRIAVETGGEHTAEALIIARYMMFTQVYFHKTRRAYDFHITEVMKELLLKAQANTDIENKEVFPLPDSNTSLEWYLKWDDWRVLGMIYNDEAGEHGERILKRDHYRSILEKPETPIESIDELEKCEKSLSETELIFHAEGIPYYKDSPETDMYKAGEKGEDDIPIILHPDEADESLVFLSNISPVVKELKKKLVCFRIYVPRERREEAQRIIIRTL